MPDSSYHRSLPASPCASRYGRVPFEDRWSRRLFRMDFVKPDRLLSPPATFRWIVTAERGIGTSCAVRVTIVPRVAPAPDTLRVPVDATELGCVRWRGTGRRSRRGRRARHHRQRVELRHGRRAPRWRAGRWSPSTSAGRGASSDAPPPFGIRVARRRRRRRDRPPRRRAGGDRRPLDGRPCRARCAPSATPTRLPALVLVDGGPPLPVDAGKHRRRSARRAARARRSPGFARSGPTASRTTRCGARIRPSPRG